MDEIRLNKFLSRAGVCSRREADRLIALGRVTVDGEKAVEGQKVAPDAEVFVDGKRAVLEDEQILLVFHKPRGMVCTANSKQSPNNVISYLHLQKRVYMIGRLDKDSEGLLLLTNQGELAHRLQKPNFEHEKEYLVQTDRPFSDEFLEKMASGVYLAELGVMTRPCQVSREGGNLFRIVLKQGYNRQIRRMCDAFGVRVARLTRVRIANICLGDLGVGQYRAASVKEEKELLKMLGLSGKDGD